MAARARRTSGVDEERTSMVAAPPVGLGLVGAGAIGIRMLDHLALPDLVESVRVVSICDPAPGRAEEAARRYGVAKATTKLEEMLADDAVDAVTIGSPIGLHHAQGIAAIEAGKHVHFNKTLATSCAEATDLIETARTRRVRLVASPGEMLRPHNQRIRSLIQEGAIGELVWACCGAALRDYHFTEPGRQGEGPLGNIDPSWYFKRPGGGPLYDMTVYGLHSLTGILGSVQRVTALSGIRITEREFRGETILTEHDDNSLMLLDFGAGLFAFVYGTAAGILSEGMDWDPSVRFFGTTGTITRTTLNGKRFTYPGRELGEGAPMDEGWFPGSAEEWQLPHIKGRHRELPEQHVFEDIMQLVDWVRDDKPTVATAEHARHVVEIIEAAYRAAETGTTQGLTTLVDGMR